jgi:hypothetical protein
VSAPPGGGAAGRSAGGDPDLYTGRIDRAPDGGIVGELVDQFGYRLVITGTRDVDRGGYTLTARVEIPAAYKIAGLDD